MDNPRALKKIVIVEDNYALSDVYKTRLELLGYTCYAAFDGVQALAVIEKELPDLVLLDLMVPKIAGDQILERMRESSWGKNIKVMVISNLNEIDAPAGLRNLGIEAYAVKANMSDDKIDELVDAILKPAGQAEDVVLGNDTANVPQAVETGTSSANNLPKSNPLSGTRFVSQTAPEEQPATENSDEDSDYSSDKHNEASG